MGLPIPNSKLGMWLFLGTEIMFFTAFIGTYIVLRIGSPGWPTDPDVTHINVYAGGVNTFVLIFSSYCVVVAHEAMNKKNFDKARKFLWITFAMAFLFLGIKGFEYAGKISHDILPGHIPETNQQAMNKTVGEIEEVVGERYSELLPGFKIVADARRSLPAAIKLLTPATKKKPAPAAALANKIKDLDSKPRSKLIAIMEKMEEQEANEQTATVPATIFKDFKDSLSAEELRMATSDRVGRKLVLALVDDDFKADERLEELRTLQKLDADFLKLQQHVKNRVSLNVPLNQRTDRKSVV